MPPPLKKSLDPPPPPENFPPYEKFPFGKYPSRIFTVSFPPKKMYALFNNKYYAQKI